MGNIITTLLYLIGLILVFVLLSYRSKKFSFIKGEKIEDYPITKYKIGSLILWLWIAIIIFGIVQETFFKNSIDTKIFLIPLILTVIYHLFGAVPSVTKSKHKINLILNWVNVNAIGFDWLGSWVGKYKNGIIVYFYLIDYNSIEISKLSKKEIIFSGREQRENIPINVTLKSKPSINYFYPLLKKISENTV